jgi:hypothetical protein
MGVNLVSDIREEYRLGVFIQHGAEENISTEER